MKAKTYAYRLNDEQVQLLVDTIVANGAGKTELANAKPTYTAFADLAQECSDAAEAEQKAYDEWQAKRTLRMAKYGTMRVQLSSFAASVDTIYDSDVAKLQALGLGIRNAPLPIGPLPAPTGVRCEAGALPRTANLRWGRVNGKKVYEAECATSPDGPWTGFYTSSGNRTTCGDLTSGAQYWFRVRAVGPRNTRSPWSQLVHCRPN